MLISEVEVAKKILEDIECIYMILVQNRICKRNKKFYCYLCKLEIKNLLGAICHATRDKEHNQRNKMCNISYEMLQDSKLDEEKSVELVFNGIVIVRLSEFFCNICLCELSSEISLTEHIKGSEHVKDKNVQNLDSNSTSTLASDSCRNINSSNNNTESNISCDNKNKEESKTIDRLPSTANYNLSDNGFITNCFESNKIQEIFEDKPVTKYGCNECKTNLINNYVVKYHKMFHISDKNYSCKNLDIVKFHFKNRNEKYIYCLICHRVTSDEIELQNHLQDINHKKNVLFLRQNYNIKNDDKITNLLVNLSAEECQNQSSVSTAVEEMCFYCQLCKVSVPHSQNAESYTIHTKGTTHIQNLQKFSEQKTNFTLKSTSDLPILKCFLCDIEFAEERELWLHYSSDLHLNLMTAIDQILQDKSIIFISDENDSGLLCNLCTTKTYDLGSMISHINSAKHLKNLKRQISTSISKEINFSHCTTLSNNYTNTNSVPESWEIGQDKMQIEKNEEPENNIFYSCPVCNIKVNCDSDLIEHLLSESHYKNYSSSSPLNNFDFLCPICYVIFNSHVQLIEHLQGINHKEVKYRISPQSSDNNIKSNNSDINQTISRYNLIDDSEEVYEHTRQAESVNTENMDAILHDLISFEPVEITDSLYSLYLLEDNFSVDSKDLSIIGKKYISLCVEPGSENIFSVNLDKLRELQLGINLTFPIESGRFCIPCSEKISDHSQLFDEHLYDEKHLKILKLLESKHRSTKKCLKDQFTDLDFAKSYMQEIVDDAYFYIKCFACNVKVEHYDSENHMILQSHERNIKAWKKSAEDIFEEKKVVFCEAWYYAEKFICDLCSLKFYSDITFVDHLIKEEHLYKVRSAQRVNTKMEYNICGYCLTFWFGKANGYLTHCEGDFHKYLLQTGSHTILKLSSAVQNILNNYEKTIEDLLELHENSDKSIETDLLQSIQRIAQVRYPYAEVFMYGSRKSLTSLSESDLDVYIDCISSYSSIMTAERSRTFLKDLWECFQKCKDTWIVEDIILQATVPIIKLRHIKTNLNCDISCINGLAVEKSELIRCYVEAYLPCRKLILFLKKWMHLCRLSGIRGINSFATSCLVIYYLQIRGILPSVHNLIKLENNPNIVAGWETGFLKKVPLLMPSETSQQLINIRDDESAEILYHPIKDLLIGFFSFYSNFNYVTDVICPFLGKIMKKKEFTSMDVLSEEMKNYKNLYEKGEAEMFRFDSPMCVQDPIDLSKNITKAITKLKLRMFKQYCYESILILNAVPSNFLRGNL